MKKIETLVEDIYGLFDKGTEFNEENVKKFGERLARHIANRIGEVKGAPILRMSNIGTPCLRKLWYQINEPEKAEPISSQTLFKFLYGDILEELLLFLAEEAGHTVEGGQDELEINGVAGHRDAIIDGVLVDVKSASSFGFKKFEEGTLAEDDAFGYIDQINVYLAASKDDERLKEKQMAAFLAVDKTLGKIALLKIESNKVDYEKRIQEIRHVLSHTKPPKRGFSDVPMGKSGNRKLGVNCSYCDFKKHCWPELQTFAYSSGPIFLTKVAKAPRVEKVEEF